MSFAIVYTVSIILAELVYFRVAEKFKIIDRPNQRSSHRTEVIRGGGIIFIIGIWLWFIESSFTWPYFLLGATLVAAISFLDDVKPQSARIRFLLQGVAAYLLFYELDVFEWSILLVLPAFIFCIATLNAFNFMDGVNGITGIYALVTLATFYLIDSSIINFTNETLLICMLIATLIFLYFNFRKMAKCFAGDVGSLTLAFVQFFFLLQLMLKTNSLWWIVLFFVFGIDSFITILIRLYRKENIFKPHRLHFYQLLSNEMRWDHRLVSILFGVSQLGLNVLLLYSWRRDQFNGVFSVSIIVLAAYMWCRYKINLELRQLNS